MAGVIGTRASSRLNCFSVRRCFSLALRRAMVVKAAPGRSIGVVQCSMPATVEASQSSLRAVRDECWFFLAIVYF